MLDHLTHSANTLPTLRGATASRAPFRETYGVTHAGCVRDENQDHFMVLDLERRVASPQSSLGALEPRSGAMASLLVVADGMGGHTNGELASAVTLDTLARYALCHVPVGDGVMPDLVQKGFEQAALECQRRMREAAARRGAPLTLGTTLTALYAHPGAAVIAHVGDSRAYGYRDARLHRLTRDHTLGALAGQAEGNEVEGRLAHTLTNAIGGSDEAPFVEGPHFALREGDRFLLCSDGLTDALDDARIEAALAEGSAKEICEGLLDEALEAEARDNVTLLVGIV